MKITIYFEPRGFLWREGGGAVATRCATVAGLPILPLGTYWISPAGYEERTGFSLPSLVAAFFKPWCFIAGLALGALYNFGAPWFYAEHHPVMALLSWVVLAAAFASWAWWGVAHSPEARSTRRITAILAAITGIALTVGTVQRAAEVWEAIDRGRHLSPTQVAAIAQSNPFGRLKLRRWWAWAEVRDLRGPALIYIPSGANLD